MSDFPKPDHAFGVDPLRREAYSLRQSRYEAMSRDISDWAGEAARAGAPLKVLDIGSASGSTLRYLEHKPHFGNIVLHGADLEQRVAYKPEFYREFFVGDLMQGYPEIPAGAYDVVVCEQVLEHLPQLEVAIATLSRVLKPGGRLIVGVPIFPPGFDVLRRHVVPLIDRAVARKKTRGHVQAFTLSSFLAAMRRHSRLEFIKARGFRIVSGGVLRPLENQRWFWRFNCRLGEMLPAACIEIQAIMRKPG